MIFLEGVSCYENGYSYELFEEEYEIDLASRLAKVDVYFQKSIDERIPNLLIFHFEECKIEQNIAELVEQIRMEAEFPKEWGDCKIIILRNYQ